MRDEAAWLDALVDAEAARRFRLEASGAAGNGREVLRIEAGGWQREETPDALARRLVRSALHRLGAGRDVSRAHLDRAVAFLRAAAPGRVLELPGGLRLDREVQGFRLGRLGLRSGGPC